MPAPVWLGLGVILAVAYLFLARRRGEEGELRAFSIGLVIASVVYVGAAAIGRAMSALPVEGAGLAVFAALAVAGARRWPMLLAGGWALHVVWDVALHLVSAQSYIGSWYPTLCVSFDLVVAGYLVWRVAAAGDGGPGGGTTMKRLPGLLFVAAWVTLLPASTSGQPATAIELDSVVVNGISMAYRVVGVGEPLVLLHGFTGTGAVWEPLFDEFSGRYRLIVPDLRGHGHSTNPSGKFTHAQSALDVFALLDRLDVDRFSAMGISTGGMTLLHMATHQPDRVEAMVLIGATSYFPERAREIMRASSPDSLSLERLEVIAQRHSRGLEQARELMAQFHAFKDSYDDMNFTPPYLSTITARTLIVHGDRDQFFPVSIPVQEYEAIPESYLWIVPGGGHVPLLGSERGRETFSEVVLGFLAGEWE